MTPSRDRSAPPGTLEALGEGSRLRSFGVYLGLWTLAALYIISALVLMRREAGPDLLLKMAWVALVRTYGWALVSILTLLLVRAVPLHRGGGLRAWAIHVVASLGVTLLGIALMAAESPLFGPTRYPFLSRVWILSVQEFHFSFLVYYWGVVGVHECIQLFRHLRERQQTAFQLQARLAQAQVEALKLQLSPHFLFNTLNAVAALMYTDPQAADRILLKLSGLLRSTLDHSAEQETTLNQELGFLESYLDIEKLRFGERLAVDVQVPPALLEALVPTFVLQPLVENAIRHGVSPRAGGGRVTLRAREEGSKLVLEVEDPGPRPPGSTTETAATRTGLQQLYGEEQRFELLAQPGGGTLARITLPRTSPARPDLDAEGPR